MLIGKKLTLSAAQEIRGCCSESQLVSCGRESGREGLWASHAAAPGHPVLLVPTALGGLPWDLLSVPVSPRLDVVLNFKHFLI